MPEICLRFPCLRKRGDRTSVSPKGNDIGETEPGGVRVGDATPLRAHRSQLPRTSILELTEAVSAGQQILGRNSGWAGRGWGRHGACPYDAWGLGRHEGGGQCGGRNWQAFAGSRGLGETDPWYSGVR